MILSGGPWDHNLDLLLMFNQVLRAKHFKNSCKSIRLMKGPVMEEAGFALVGL